MNPVSSHSGGPGAGPVYRRGSGLAPDSPELRALAEREFPAAASELFDPVSRREFVRLMSASLALAGVGLTGCRRPVETIHPFSKMPEGYVHGVARYYASAMPRRGGAVPVLVRSNDGRPTKIEGNPEHPLNRIGDGAEGPAHGGTDLLAQASILDLYDPDRARRFTFNGETVARERVLDELARAGKALAARQGEGLAILVDGVDSPTLERLRRELLAQWPKARWFVDEPLSPVGERQGLKAAFGQPVRPLYRLERAKRILSLDADLV
ncbi:MAG: hydrogenase, partial [Verrucomicrobia bacterium]